MPADLQASLTPAPGTRAPGSRRRARIAGATALAWLAVVVALGSHFLPSTEAVRVRNSFLAETGTPADFDWAPPAVPPGFLQQSGAAPAPFVDAAARTASADGALARAIAMLTDLNPGKRRGGAIQGDTLAAYSAIRAEGTGYCADYTQVVNGLAWAAGVPVREWGISFDGFGGDGHAFNEFFDAATGRWVMLDVFNGFWVRDRASGAPLSALAFRDRLRLPDPLASVELVRIRDPGIGFRSAADMIGYYRRGVDQFYLWWGNNVFDYDADPAVRFAGRFARGAEQLAAILAGVHPRIRIVPTEANGPMVEALAGTRARVATLAAAAAALGIALVIQLVLWWRARRRDG